jgi:hypothetical protein
MENLKIKLLKYAGHPHQWPWFVFIAAGLLVLIYWIVFRALPWTSDPSAWGSFGDYMGGLLNPAVSTLTLVVAIKVWAQQREELEETKRALKDQAETAQANRREQRFFDLILEENSDRYIRLFRAQLSQTELILLGLHLWLDEGGRRMQGIAGKFKLVSDLPVSNLRDLLENKLPAEIFGRQAAKTG